MKTLTIIIAILGSAVLLNAQTDIIYPAEGGNIIFDCKINEVKNGNKVYYMKDSTSDSVLAVAITKDGNYIDLSEYVSKMNRDKVTNRGSQTGLYRGFDYDYYQEKHSKATSLEGIGLMITTIGVGSAALGYFGIISDDYFIAGVMLLNIGLPLAIMGSVMAANNRKAMEMTKSNTNLSFGVTNNGVGLVLNF